MSTIIGSMVAVLGVDTTGLIQANTAMIDFEKRVTTSMNNASQRLRTYGYLWTAMVTAPMLMAGRASFKMASDYEFSIQKIVGLTGTAQQEVNQWSKEIEKLSKSVGKKPSELAEGLYFIASSGIHGSEALEVLNVSAKAAASGLGETQKMAEVLTSALNAYRGTGLTAAQATDIIVAGVREGKAEAAGFATSLGQLIPIAANLGLSFDQVVGGMAAITLTGASAANAAVYLKGVMNMLLTANDQGAKELEKVGLSYAALRDTLQSGPNGLVNVMQQLMDVQNRLGQEALKNVAPNIRALTGILSFAGKNFKYNTELMERVTNSNGALAKAFEAVADTIKMRYDKAVASVNVNLIKLGKIIAEAVLPLIEGLANRIERLTKRFEALTQSQQRHILIIVAAVAAAGPLALLFSAIGYTISGLIGIFAKLTVALRTVTVLTGGAMAINPVLAMITIMGALILRWTLLKSKVREVSEAQKEYNNLVKEGQSLKDSATPIESRMSVVTTLSQEQLRTLKDNINMQKSLEQDHLSDIIAQAKKILEQDTKTQELRRKVQEASSDMYKLLLAGQLKAREEFLTKELNAEYVATQQRIKTYEAYLAKVLPMIAEINTTVTETIIDDFNEMNYALEKYRRELEKLNEVTTTPTFNAPNYTKLLRAGGGPPTFLESVNTELKRTAEYNRIVGESANTLTDSIEIYKRAIETLYNSEQYRTGNMEAIVVMQKLVSEYDNLISQQDRLAYSVRRMASTIGNALSDIANQLGSAFMGTENSWMGIVDTILQTANSVINVLLAEAAAALLMHKAVSMPIGGLIAGGIAVGALMAMWEGYKGDLATAAQMKSGGIVPSGYPNDSYPALLTSGEMVTPPGQIPGLGSALSKLKIEWEGEISGKVIKLALRRAELES